MSKLITCLLLCLGAGLFASDKEAWSYKGTTGPGYWACLDSKNVDCAQGLKQSPIDLSSRSQTAKAPELVFKYPKECDLKLSNNGHTVVARPPEGVAQFTLDGKTYVLDQFHFHTRSEHTVDGKDFPMELHLVHKTSEGELAVIGYFLSLGKTNEVLAPIFSNLPTTDNPNHEVPNFNLSGLVPRDTKMFRYSGSLTTPDCGQKVSWHVLTKPLQISPDQFKAFHELFSGPEFPQGNRRPIQPVNGRQVLITP